MIDLDTLDLRKLRAFRLVARYGSLRAAASRLNVTVSAVSFSIRRLETQLGIELFQRFPNRLVLTTAGARFAYSVEAIFDGIDQVLADSALDVISGGRLSVSVNSDLVWYFIPRISDFLKRYPEVELRIHINRSSQTLRLVERGEIDLGIGRFLEVPNEIETEPIVESSISLVCAPDHPLSKRKRPRLQDLLHYKLITLPEGHSTRRVIDAAFSRARIRTRSYIEVGNCQTVREIVGSGIGIGLVHSLCTQREPVGNLYHLNLNRHFGNMMFSAVHLKKAASSPALLKMLKDYIRSP